MATVGPVDVSVFLKDFRFGLQLQTYQIKLAESFLLLGDGFRRFEVQLSGSAKAARDFAKTVQWIFFWKEQHRHFQAYGMTRPNGKPRRSGRRHKGMPAWRGHYAD